jgi:hypothetical protein
MALKYFYDGAIHLSYNRPLIFRILLEIARWFVHEGHEDIISMCICHAKTAKRENEAIVGKVENKQ